MHSSFVFYSDGLFASDYTQIYRCFVIWRGISLVILFPVLVFMASTALSVAFVVLSSTASMRFSVASVILTTSTATGLARMTVQRLILAYFSLSIGLNILVALMISVKLMHFKYTMEPILGAAHVRHYTTITAMVVESAALYAAVGLCTLIACSLANAILIVFISIQGIVQVA
jgi:hypothetical protein